jgi:D-lactate dehydratase
MRKAADLNPSDYGLFFASAGFASVYDYPVARACRSSPKTRGKEAA